ncbi:transposase [Roseinatronobacter thiooxidans]|uniref:Transposase n=1 Tax=Roseinatronobacter thiooxidans TaxID=121821 RepID=A0A2W7QBC6_9RHOB|nr:transposase [Roseinatronobacter thiooxidans]PZX35815.1 transposase [Roseinatronobacter thiooxidans]
MRGEILGVERRRYWGDDEKLAIVSAVGVGGATVTQIAQRYEVTRQQIYAWRHELKRKGLWSPDAGALFLRVDAPSIPDLPAVTNPAPSVWVELRLARGRMLRFESDIAETALTRLIRAVDEA